MSMKKLKDQFAPKYTIASCRNLVAFLNRHENLPIVAFNVQHDRTEVMAPSFYRLGCTNILPREERWKCAFEMSKDRLPNLFWCLDDCLEACNIPRRKKNKPHDAIIDCKLTAQLYMKLMVMPPKPIAELGICGYWEKD